METPVQQESNQQLNTRSIELLLSTAQNEYSNEHERTTTIDSKAGIALPIMATYFLALAQMNDYKAIITISVYNFWSSLFPILLFVAYTLGLMFSLLSVVFMAQVVFTRDYCKINPKEIYKTGKVDLPFIDFTKELMSYYLKAIEFNRDVNNKRVKLYKRSWIIAFASVLFFVVYIITKNSI